MAARGGSRPIDSFEVNIKDFSGDSMVIKVDPTWNVGRIKEEIAHRRSLEARDFKIVFAGQTLSDELTLWVRVCIPIGASGSTVLVCRAPEGRREGGRCWAGRLTQLIWVRVN